METSKEPEGTKTPAISEEPTKLTKAIELPDEKKKQIS